MRVSAPISNRRVRTRTHGGVAGVSGQPLPLCRSNAFERSREEPAGERGHQDYASPDHAANQLRTDPPPFLNGRFLPATFSRALEFLMGIGPPRLCLGP